MADHDDHSSFIKTPQQLITIVVLAFVIPITGIVMLVHLVASRPSVDPGALKPEMVSARLAPVGSVEVGAPPAPAGSRAGEEIVKNTCGVCHTAGVAGAPKIGDKASWSGPLGRGLNGMLAIAIKGSPKGMPPRGGVADLTDVELSRAIVFMANQSGGSLKEPAAPAATKPAAEAKKK
jgi:cytochrome c5